MICDEDGLYDPADFNDRLLLGLKGTMSEAELHFIRARLQGGILSKARRGELPMPLPVGLVYDPAGKVVLDPDRAVQDALRHLFATFARTGSARAVVYAFNRDGLLFPSRIRKGQRKGELAWNELTHWRVLRTLHNPRYAGAFAYGQRRTRKTPDGRTTTRQLPREQWITLIPDAHPGYLTWEQFEHNQTAARRQRLCARHRPHRRPRPRRTRAAARPRDLRPLRTTNDRPLSPTPRHARARLPLRQRQHPTQRPRLPPAPRPHDRPRDRAAAARRPSPRSRSRSRSPSKPSSKPAPTKPTSSAAHTSTAPANTPSSPAAAISLSIPTTGSSPTPSKPTGTTRCARCKPPKTNTTAKPPPPTPRSTTHRKAQIRQLATDFPKLWSDPATPARERKRIARLLIEDVTINKTDQIHLHIRFRGGQTTSLTIPIPLNAWQARQTDPDTFAMLDRLLDDHTDAETAEQLNAAGRRTGTNKPFTAHIVLHIRRAHGLPSHPTDSAPAVCSRSTRPLNDSACTPARSRPGTAPDCSPPTKPTTRTSGSSTHPTPTTPDSNTHKAGGCDRPRTHPTIPTRCTMKPTPSRARPAGPAS